MSASKFIGYLSKIAVFLEQRLGLSPFELWRTLNESEFNSSWFVKSIFLIPFLMASVLFLFFCFGNKDA